jgi:PAS domain S-box
MRLRTKYILFIGLLHVVTLVLSFYIFKNNRLLFIISEAFILISLVLSWQLYNQLIEPLKTLLTGIDALKNRDFNVKFRNTGMYEMDQLIEVYNKMVDHLRIERTKQEEQHFFLEKLINTSPTGIIILDHDNLIQQVNPKTVQILNIEEKELFGRTIGEIQHPLLQQAINLRSGESTTISINGIETYKIQMSHFIDRGFARNFVMIEELTAEILAAEKKVYGKVIRMMAHEVNNTIGPVNSILNSTLHKKDLWQNNADNSLPDALQVAIDRNNNLNGFMRNFADLVKLPQPSKANVELNKLVQGVSRLMEVSAREKNISLGLHLTESPMIIYADVQQMEQALINIVKNSIEAVEANGSVAFFTDAKTRKLIITDTGKGIKDIEYDQLFAPFYSTKKNGQGIGLTLVREILLNHNFTFSLKTVARGRTEFSIKF